MSSKARLTITLSQDVLRKVDGLIDGKNVRNRSHAIEYLVRQSLKPSVDTAVILAGGKPKRQPPAPLTLIDGRPLIFLTIDHLRHHGIKKIIICAGHLEDKLRRILSNGEGLGVKISYIKETGRAGTAGALKKTTRYLKENPFLVIHGDVLTDLNLDDFANFHKNEGLLATIGVKPRMAETNYGRAILQGNKIIKFLKSSGDKGISIVNTGIYLLEPEVVELIPSGSRSNLETDIFPELARKRQLGAFIFQGIWFDISRPESFHEAVKRWKQKSSL